MNGNIIGYCMIVFSELFLITLFIGYIIYHIYKAIKEHKKKKQRKKIEKQALQALQLKTWLYTAEYDTTLPVKSAQTCANYTQLKYFQENHKNITKITENLNLKAKYKQKLLNFLQNNNLKYEKEYEWLCAKIEKMITNLDYYTVRVLYVSPKGRSTHNNYIKISQKDINEIKANPTVIYPKRRGVSQIQKGLDQKELLEKQQWYYARVNRTIDLANSAKDIFVIESDKDKLDEIIYKLFDNTVPKIVKIKKIHTIEWQIIEDSVQNDHNEIIKLIEKKNKLVDYYNSKDFETIKQSCLLLMSSQKEFNEYIDEKTKAIAACFGRRVLRNETVTDDQYNYIHQYKKSITPFTAEVSSSVFASAENNPLEYVIKYFYPNKETYPEQIQNLQTLIQELETLKEAKRILDTYKKDYQQYLKNVPDFVWKLDEDGFYSRLGFARVDEASLTVNYKFAYTSNGGRSQRSFTIPMTEEMIVELVSRLENKLTQKAFAKEQRALMTSKLRNSILERDNYTCRYCGNSTYKEPNLLLEVDHILPIKEGGCTVEDNLQTLCWRCNRNKGAKLVKVPQIPKQIKIKIQK